MMTTMTVGAEFLLRVEVNFQQETLYSNDSGGAFFAEIVRPRTLAEQAEARRRFLLNVKTDFGSVDTQE